jgi:ATP-dependent RNA helicase DeaD
MLFSEMSLNPQILKAIIDLGYETPTEIQAKAIPLLLEADIDFVGQAKTGTGKTAAFVLPLLQKLKKTKSNNIEALILTPTRELAKQVSEAFDTFAKYMDVKTALVYGGTSYDKQIGSIKKDKPQVIIGTPGRIIDLMERGVLNFEHTGYFVLDEADEMLNMGFLDDVKLILEKTSEDRNIWMFSATMPNAITELIKHNFKNPHILKGEQKTLSNQDIEQSFFVVERKKRFEALYRLILKSGNDNGIVFCRTKAETAEVFEKLISRGVRADCLHGDMSQELREKSMNRFKKGTTKFLVCTDVASRGIDVNDLSVVINFGLPQDIESYVHRIGRTGRAGNKGLAYTLIEDKEFGYLRKIEYVIGQKIQRGIFPTLSELKKALINKEADRMKSLLESIQEKGEEFQLDQSYEDYKESLKEVEVEELKKLLFTLTFNKEFRQLNDHGEIASPSREEGRRDQSARPPQRRSGGYRRDGDRGGERSSSGGGGYRRDNSRGASARSTKKAPFRSRSGGESNQQWA